jgi:hypothetical protein
MGTRACCYIGILAGLPQICGNLQESFVRFVVFSSFVNSANGTSRSAADVIRTDA